MATPYRLKRSSVTGKRPALADLEKGELGLNFYDGHLFAERDTGGVGIATTIANLTPWKENFGGGSIIYSGVVTATTYHGDQIVGTPTGGSFRAGAMASPTVADKTKDQVEEINYILGKLVPAAPPNIGGKAFSFLDSARNSGWSSSDWTRSGYLCAGFTPVNHTGGAFTPTTTTLLDRNVDNKFQSTTITQVGPGDSGTVEGFVNGVGIGTTTLNVTFGLYAVKSDNGTYGDLVISNDQDYADVAGIASNFYEVYDVKINSDSGTIGYACSTGVCMANIKHGANTSANAYWYEDPSVVTAPVVSFSAVTPPSSPEYNWSSGVPHYKNHANNSFSYVITIVNASGDMYYYSDYKLIVAENQTTGFTKPVANLKYNQFYQAGVQGTHPPQRNFGVGTGVTATVSHVVRDAHTTITSSTPFHGWDCYTPYGQHVNQHRSVTYDINLMGTSAITDGSPIDEDSIYSDVGSDTGGSGTRVNAGATGDTPSPVYTSWTANATPAVYEAIVRGGVLRHDVTDYSNTTNWMPAGPNLSSGRSGAQYFQVMLQESAISQFNIEVAGTYAGCWVCIPDNSAWTTGLSNTNGWADMFDAYSGSGTPNNADNGCSSGGVMTGSSGTFKCVFGEQTTSNASSPYRILIRFKLTSGQSITTLRFEDV